MAWWSSLDDDIYVPLEDVKTSADAASPLSVEAWPRALAQHVRGPTAVFARHVASPNYEMLWFSRLARRHGFHTLVIEHASDQFTVHNPAKLALATVPIVTGRSRSGQPIFRRQRILDPAASEGQALEEIVTQSGERLLDYHHRKLHEVMRADAPDIIDLREVVPASAGNPAKYYLEFFKMLTGHLVLLEDFVANDQTAGFFQNTVLPAWRCAVADTGRRPQIARLTPVRRATSTLWSAYPAAVADNPRWLRRSQISGEAK